MLFSNPNNGEPNVDLHSSNNGDTNDARESHRLSEEMDSTCSTPYVSAPSSPGRGCPAVGYFFSAPTSPMHYVLSTAPRSDSFLSTEFSSFEFEFSSRFSPSDSVGNGSMSSADELFLNGQIRPMKLSSHLQRPQILAPLLDLEHEDDESDDRKDSQCENREESVTRGRDLRSRNRSLHRKARSMSPLRTAQFQWQEHEENEASHHHHHHHHHRILELEDSENKEAEIPSIETTPSCSASSSRSSSSGRNSKKWIFLKDLLYRSKSEGRGNKEKFWSSITFTSSSSSRDEKEKNRKETETQKQKKKQKRSKQVLPKKPIAGKPANGVGKRRVPPSAHELHYTANRAQAEEMKKKTFLPYRQGLLGCLGLSSKGYGALNGFTRTLNPVSSR